MSMGIENMVAARPHMEKMLLEADDRSEYEEWLSRQEKPVFTNFSEFMSHEIEVLQSKIEKLEPLISDPESADEVMDEWLKIQMLKKFLQDKFSEFDQMQVMLEHFGK